MSFGDRPRGALSRLDVTDQEIIRLLSQDGRMPYRELARRVSLSETRVRQRVLRLMERGYLHIAALTNPLKFGADTVALVGVRASGNLVELAETIALEDETTFVAIVAGIYDLLVEIACEDNTALLAIVDRFRAIPGVLHTDTLIYLKWQKILYSGGPGISDAGPKVPEGGRRR